MPRKLPPRPAKGTRHPGAGRVKGYPNRISVEARTLAGELVNNPNYQHKLRRDFEARRVHPTIESLVWAYHLGKPNQPVELAGTLDVTGRLAEERAAFAQLDLADLEQLAAESQALVNRAFALAKIADNGHARPLDIVVEAKHENPPSELLGNTTESYKGSYVNQPSPDPNIPITPDDTAD